MQPVRELINRYLLNDLSRRGLIRKMAQLGFSAAAAQTVARDLQAADSGGAWMEGTGGELVVAQAKAAGARYLFTNPGSFEVGIFDALVGDKDMNMIMALHEGIVIAMADGYHRVSLQPAFVNVHVIAGTAQAAGQLFNASRDGSALVVTAGLNDNQAWSDETILAPRPGYDQKDVNRQFTKISWDARQAGSLPMMLRRAFKVAATAPGGPVYLAMAHYALEARGVKAQILPAERFLFQSRTRPDTKGTELAAKALIESRRPLIIAGDEVWKSGAQAELITLAEKLGVPVCTDRQGFCNFPAHHPHNLGGFGATAEWRKKGADLLVFIGSRDMGGKVVPAGPELPTDAKIVRIGIDTASMSRNYQTDIALVADVKAALADLTTAVDAAATKQRLTSLAASRAAEVKAHTKPVLARATSVPRATTGHSPMHPDEIGHVIARTMDKNAIVVTENLTGKYEAFPFGYRPDEPWYITNTGLGLGWGVGAAAGAKLAAPDRQVICTIGDGSVMYQASGFWSQVRYGIPVITVVYNNKNYQTVRHAYHSYKGKMTATGSYPGMYLGDPDIDFVKLAESQGMKGEKAATGAELEAAMKRGAKSTRDGKPYLIEVATARYGGGAESTWHGRFKLKA